MIFQNLSVGSLFPSTSSTVHDACWNLATLPKQNLQGGPLPVIFWGDLTPITRVKLAQLPICFRPFHRKYPCPSTYKWPL